MKLTRAERLVLIQASKEVLAGDGAGWTVADFKSLTGAADKLRQQVGDVATDGKS